ncbi:MAG: SDR family oxidoreductase [Pseudomonadota bacterium]
MLSENKKKIVIVTGGTGGIGFATARILLDRGYSVIAADRNKPSPEQLEMVKASGDNLTFATCEASNQKDVDALITLAGDMPGRLHGLVNALGIEVRRRLVDLDMSEVRETLEANLIGSILPSQAAVRHWLDDTDNAQEAKSIVHISSVNGLIASSSGHTAYGSSKGALVQLTRVMAVELAPHNIRVNAVAPGSVRTQMMDSLIKDQPTALDRVMARTPMKRMGEPEEIAATTAFFLSSDASYVTGQILYADGGRTAQNLPSE